MHDQDIPQSFAPDRPGLLHARPRGTIAPGYGVTELKHLDGLARQAGPDA